MSAMNSKLDGQGNYLPFHGVTVVHSLKQDDHDPETLKMSSILRQVEQFLCQSKLLANYYAPLPFSSYHMTLYDVQTAHQQTLEQWRQYIQTEEEKHYTWSKLSSICNDAQKSHFAPRVLISELYYQSTIGFVLALSHDDLAYATGLRKQLSHVMDRPCNEYKFHMTLAYQKQAIPMEHRFGVQQEVSRLIVECFGDRDASPGGVFVNLAPPRLCAFTSMTAFPEWKDPSKGWPYNSP